MNPARLPRRLLSPFSLSVSWTPVFPPLLCLFSLFLLCLLTAPRALFYPLLCLSAFFLSVPRAFFFFIPFFLVLSFSLSVTHGLPHLSSLVLFHTRSPPHKVAFLSLISLFPRSFLLPLSCAFEIPFSSLALSLALHPPSHTYAQTLAHSVILLLSQN